MCGVQVPILLALLEYGFILGMKKYSHKTVGNLDEKILKIDMAFFGISITYFFLFNVIYWGSV
jgi:hypothetical protein